MGLRSYLTRAYTTIDRSVFGGRLPSGAPRPAPATTPYQGTVSSGTTGLTFSTAGTPSTGGGGGTTVIASPTAQQITTAQPTIPAVTTAEERKPATIIAKHRPTLLLTPEDVAKGRTTPSLGSTARQAFGAIGVPIGKSSSTLTDRDVSRFSKLVGSMVGGYAVGGAFAGVSRLAPRGVSAVTGWGLKAVAPVFAGMETVKLYATPKGARLKTLAYDVVSILPEAVGFGAGYQKVSKSISKTIGAGTKFIPRSIYRGGRYKGKGQVQAQEIDTSVYQTDYIIDYKLPKFYKYAKQRLPKSARQTYEVLPQGEISMAGEQAGLKIVEDTGMGKIFSTTKYYDIAKRTIITGRLKGKPTPTTIITGKPTDILLPKQPKKGMPFYDTSKVVLGRGSPIDTGRIRPFEGTEYKFKGQFKKDVYLGEKGYSVKLLDKKTAQAFDYDKPIGLITGAPIIGKRLRGLRDLPKPKKGKLRAEDILGVGIGRTRRPITPTRPTRPTTEPSITGTIPKEIFKPPKIGDLFTQRSGIRTIGFIPTRGRTRPRQPTVTDILTDTKVTTDVTTDVITKIRTDTRTRTRTDVAPPVSARLPPARPPIAPLAMWGILPFGGGGRGYNWNKRIKGKEVGGRFMRSFTANVLGLKAPRKRKYKSKYTGFELRI